MMKFCVVCEVVLAQVAFLILPRDISAKLCSDVRSRDVVKEIEYKEPCTQKYTARCGWLSLDYCTFYHQTFCNKKRNDTVTTYYVVTHCCQGYYKAPNGSCLLLNSGVDNSKPTTIAPEYVFMSNGGNHSHKPEILAVKKTSGEPELKISIGGYAGIICGFAFICAVTFFIIRAVRKRLTRKPKKIPPQPKMAVALVSSPPSPRAVPPDSVPLYSPLLLSGRAGNNINNDADEGVPLSAETIEDETMGIEYVVEADGVANNDVIELKEIPESVV